MHHWLLLGAIWVVQQHNGVDCYPVSKTSTTTSSEREFQPFRTSWRQMFSPVPHSSDGSSTSFFATTIGTSTCSQHLTQTTAAPIEAKSATGRLTTVDVLSIHGSSMDKDRGKDIDEEIQSPILLEVLGWLIPLIGGSFTLTVGWYRPLQKPATFWTVGNFLAAAAILPFHNPSTLTIPGNAVKGFAVAANVHHFQATVGVSSRPVIGLVITIVGFFLIYSQRRNLIGDGPEDKALRAVAPWICAPLAIVTVSELFKLLQWLKAICSAIIRSIWDAIDDRPPILEHGLQC